ncbi:hypothetical protein ABZT48_29270 [Streptomyces avermitilis]|uniref:hypothetical protein n=1 Tax=Streptomyces avermitilis TaxID=33903 RepID=UPI0033AA8F83
MLGDRIDAGTGVSLQGPYATSRSRIFADKQPGRSAVREELHKALEYLRPDLIVGCLAGTELALTHRPTAIRIAQ